MLWKDGGGDEQAMEMAVSSPAISDMNVATIIMNAYCRRQ
jgi:hypothetical protein